MVFFKNHRQFLLNYSLQYLLQESNLGTNKRIKGVWGMPRLSEAMKDVTSCDKLRGSAHTN